MVPSNHRLLGTAVSVPQLSSGSRSEPQLTDCRLATMVRSRERTHLRRARGFGCQKHEISGSRGTSTISGPRLHIDCGQYWSTRLGNTWATGTDRALANPVNPAAQTIELEESGVSQQPLASRDLSCSTTAGDQLWNCDRKRGPISKWRSHIS